MARARNKQDKIYTIFLSSFTRQDKSKINNKRFFVLNRYYYICKIYLGMKKKLIVFSVLVYAV